MHLICNEDSSLSISTEKYGVVIEKILKGYCVQYFTLQFEFSSKSEKNQCFYGLRRKCRGHRVAEENERKSVINVE